MITGTCIIMRVEERDRKSVSFGFCHFKFSLPVRVSKETDKTSPRHKEHVSLSRREMRRHISFLVLAKFL